MSRISHIHICGTGSYKPGDPAPKGYLDWHEWARVQVKAKLKQKRCSRCSRWKFPQELSDKTDVTHPVDAKTRKRVRVESPICLECAPPVTPREGKENEDG